LNPLLFISIDLSGQVPAGSKRALVKRIIANTTIDSQKTYFDTNLKGRNDITQEDFVNLLTQNGINYFIDESEVDLPLQVVRYKGDFAVMRVIDQKVDIISNGTTTQQNVRKYKLDTLQYTDILSTGVNSNRQLKEKDTLMTKNGTKYQITSIDTSENTVVLKRLSGFEAVPVGDAALTIASDILSPLELQVNVAHDERQGVFVKSIDDEHHVAGTDYSKGIFFWSNELQINTTNGVKNLDDFYKEFVSDFGLQFMSNVKEKIVPSVHAVTPTAPVLSPNNFKVVVINKQILKAPAVVKFKDTLQTKVQLKNELEAIDKNINQIRKNLVEQSVTSVTKSFTADREKLVAKIDSLSKEKVTKTQLLSSTIQDITNIHTTAPEISEAPKYRVRGFWPFPSAVTDEKTGTQEVIQFRVRYRYLTKDGNTPQADEIKFQDTDGNQRRGTFSNWNEFKSDIRKKIIDPSTGKYKWLIEDVENADTPNINQLDIPITKGERVEIKVSAISEGGWPHNAAESPFSESVIIDFPDSLAVEADNGQYLTQNSGDATLVKMQQDLSAKGLDNHLSTSFTSGDKYYSHTSNSIASGFFDGAGKAIDLFVKLQAMDQELSSLRALITKAKGVLAVYLRKGSNLNKIKNGETVNLFAGYYNEIIDLTNPSNYGKIATVTYQLELRNEAASPLELASLIPGGQKTSALVNTSPTASNDYANNRKYDLTPISLSSIKNSSLVPGLTGGDSFIQASPYQSGNANSQFIYPRFKSVGFNENLYFAPKSPTGTYTIDTGVLGSTSTPIPSNNGILIPYGPTGTSTPGTANANLWNGTYTSGSPNGNGRLNEFCIHISHPSIVTEASLASPRDFRQLIRPSQSTSGFEYPHFRHSLGFEIGETDTLDTLITDQSKGYQQVQFSPSLNTSYGSTGSDFAYPYKLGFDEDDEYLVGKYSCGAYLFASPSNHATIQIEGSTSLASKILQFGEQNAIVVPINFQFRCQDKLGYIGGFRTSGAIKNITYTKKIGLDVQVKNEDLFSFDLVVSGSYTKTAVAAPQYSSAKQTLMD
jgi:hypothetical protein